MRKTAIILIFFTGFSGLVFQVVWQKYLSYFLGGEALASVSVVSVFLGGLSLGYAIFGKLSRGRSPSQLVKLAGAAELGIGIWAFLFPTFFELVWNNLSALPAAQPARGIIDILLTVLLLSPATILMGSTLPLLTSGLSEKKEALSKVHSKVYGWNTLGAFLGAILAGFIIIKTMGLPIALMSLCSLNVIAGLILLAIGENLTKEVSAEAAPSKTAKAQTPGLKLVLAIALLTGFISIGFEIIFMRSVSLAVGTSEYSYSLVVGVFILMIALGTLSLRWKAPTEKRLFLNQVFLTGGLIVVFLTVPWWGWLNYVVRTSLVSLPSNFYVYYFVIFLLISFLISIPVFFMGRTMPLLFSGLESDMKGAGQNVGRIYAYNTIGCCLGGIILGYVLFLHFDADAVFRIGMTLSCACIFLTLLLPSALKTRKMQKLGMVAVMTAILFMLPSWPQAVMSNGLFRSVTPDALAFSHPADFLKAYNSVYKVLAYRDDPNTNVTIIENSQNPLRSLIVNGKSDGISGGSDLLTTLLLGHLPPLFSTASGDAAIVGLGLGTSAASVAMHSNINHVDVFEIAQAIIDDQHFFENVNKNIGANPKVTIAHADAFRGLLATSKKYSVVISEPSNPWVSGVDRLFSTEFYEIVKYKLAAGGVFAQWMHTYEMSPKTFGMVIKTFSESFPNLWIATRGADVILLGSDQPWTEERFKTAESRWKTDMTSVIPAMYDVNEFSDLARFEASYPIAAARRFATHSLFFPKLGYDASYDFFLHSDFILQAMQATDPLFALNDRNTSKNSLTSYLIKSKPDFPKRILSACTKVGDNNANFNFDQLTSICKSRILFLAVNKVITPPQDQAKLNEMVSWLQKVESHAEKIETQLTLSDQLSVLNMYPAELPPPSEKFILTTAEKCGAEVDKKNCMFSTASLFIRFNYLVEAKKYFETQLTESAFSPAERSQYLQMLAVASFSERAGK
jgi:spermidine synthase